MQHKLNLAHRHDHQSSTAAHARQSPHSALQPVVSSNQALNQLINSQVPSHELRMLHSPKFWGLSQELMPKLSAKAAIQARSMSEQSGDRDEQEADRIADQVVKQLHSTQPDPVSPTPVQTPGIQCAAQGGLSVSHSMEASIQQACSGGESLPPLLRTSMEQAFGAEFSQVKIHTDFQADRLNRSLQARAFTTKHDIFFRQGAYAPDSTAGKQLIAHELTHVLQQRKHSRGLNRAIQPKLIFVNRQQREVAEDGNVPESKVNGGPISYTLIQGHLNYGMVQLLAKSTFGDYTQFLYYNTQSEHFTDKRTYQNWLVGEIQKKQAGQQIAAGQSGLGKADLEEGMLAGLFPAPPAANAPKVWGGSNAALKIGLSPQQQEALKRHAQEQADLQAQQQQESDINSFINWMESLVGNQTGGTVDPGHQRVNYYPTRTHKTKLLNAALAAWSGRGDGYHGFPVELKDGIRQAHFLMPQPVGSLRFMANIHVKPSD